MEDYINYRRQLEKQKTRTGNENLANYQFVQAVNSLTGMNYDMDCNKFSLRDKAHVRTLIQLAKKSQVREKSSLADSVASLNAMKKVHPKLTESVEAFSSNIGALEEESRMLDQLTSREEQGLQDETNKRRELVFRLQDLKAEFDKMKESRNEQEKGLAERCGATIQILERKKADLIKEIEPLQIQYETYKVKENILDEAQNQAERAELLGLETELKDFQIKTAQLTLTANQFLRDREREYGAIQEEWAQVMQERRSRLSQLDQLKEKEREIRALIDEAQHQTKWASRMETILKLDEESEIRNKKFNLPKRSQGASPRETGKKHQQQEQTMKSPQNTSKDPIWIEKVSPSMADGKLVATSTTGSKTATTPKAGKLSGVRTESLLQRSDEYFLHKAPASPTDPEGSFQDLPTAKAPDSIQSRVGVLQFHIPNVSAGNSVPPSEEVRYESADSSSPGRLAVPGTSLRHKQSALSQLSKKSEQNSEAGLTFAGKFAPEDIAPQVQSNRNVLSLASESGQPTRLVSRGGKSEHFLDAEAGALDSPSKPGDGDSAANPLNAALEEVVAQSKAKFRKMEQVVELMLALHGREDEEARADSRGSLGYSSSRDSGEHSAAEEVRRLRGLVAQVLHELR